MTGRTRWDREQLAVLAPKAAYYPCGETLRPAFYGPEWDPKAQDPEAPVLFLSQGNYPLKGLHQMCIRDKHRSVPMPTIIQDSSRFA